MVGRQDDADGFQPDGHRGERSREGAAEAVRAAEGEVEVTGEQTGQGLGQAVAQCHLERHVVGLGAQQVVEQGDGGQALVGHVDAQRGMGVGDFFDQTLSLRQETPATLDESLACGRQGGVAAVSDEQRDAEALLQAADLDRVSAYIGWPVSRRFRPGR